MRMFEKVFIFREDDKHTYHVMQLSMGLPKPMIHSGHLRYMYGIDRGEKLDNEFLYHRPKDASHRNIVPHAKDSNSGTECLTDYSAFHYVIPKSLCIWCMQVKVLYKLQCTQLL